jgi:hypothetical protein
VGRLHLAEMAGLSRGCGWFSTTGHGLAKVSGPMLSTGPQSTITGGLAGPGEPRRGA